MKYGVYAAIWCNILSSVIGITALFLPFLNFMLVRLGLTRKYTIDAMRYGFKVYLGNFTQFLHYKIDIFIVNILLNPLAVGLYSIAAVLSGKLCIISDSAGIVLYQRVTSELRDEKRNAFTPIICRNIIAITFISLIVFGVMSDLIVRLLYSENYFPSVIPLKFLLIGTLSMSGWKILANDIAGRGKPELNIYVSLFSLLTLNLFMNLIFIPMFADFWCRLCYVNFIYNCFFYYIISVLQTFW